METNHTANDTRFGVVSRKVGAAIGLTSGAVFLAFALAGYESAGSCAAASLLVVLLGMRMSWPMRHERWFWPLFAGVAVLHAFAVIHAPEIEARPSYEYVPYVLADLAVVMAVVWVATKAFAKGS